MAGFLPAESYAALVDAVSVLGLPLVDAGTRRLLHPPRMDGETYRGSRTRRRSSEPPGGRAHVGRRGMVTASASTVTSVKPGP